MTYIRVNCVFRPLGVYSRTPDRLPKEPGGNALPPASAPLPTRDWWLPWVAAAPRCAVHDTLPACWHFPTAMVLAAIG